MAQYVRLATDPEFSGDLTLSRAPDGSLSFEDGEAEVADDVDVEWLVDRYPNLTTDEVSDTDESDDSDDGDDATAEDVEGEDDGDTDEFDEMDYDQLQERAGEHDDIKGNQSAAALRDALRDKEA